MGSKNGEESLPENKIEESIAENDVEGEITNLQDVEEKNSETSKRKNEEATAEDWIGPLPSEAAKTKKRKGIEGSCDLYNCAIDRFDYSI